MRALPKFGEGPLRFRNRGSAGGDADRNEHGKGADEKDQGRVLEEAAFGLVLGRVAHVFRSALLWVSGSLSRRVAGRSLVILVAGATAMRIQRARQSHLIYFTE